MLLRIKYFTDSNIELNFNLKKLSELFLGLLIFRVRLIS